MFYDAHTPSTGNIHHANNDIEWNIWASLSHVINPEEHHDIHKPWNNIHTTTHWCKFQKHLWET